MYIVNSYFQAVLMCFVTMICWGSWANTQKLSSKKISFSLFYWDYTLGVILLSLIAGLSLGTLGDIGQSFISNLKQASLMSLGMAFMGGVIFNLANLLLVAAIEIAGMAIAFPVAIGIALVLGVMVNYIAMPLGEPILLFSGLCLVVIAIVLDALAYRKISAGATSNKGIAISILSGILMGFFFRFVAASITPDFKLVSAGMLTPYAALFIFSIGIFISNFFFNTYFMYKPISGKPVTYKEYFSKSNFIIHLTGISGGFIWCLGMLLSLLASEKAGFAISYGLGQGATMIAAIWGVFVWKEFKNAPKGVMIYVNYMFASFLLGLGLIILSRII